MAELVGVAGIAVVQPLLADLGAAPDWFVFVGATAGQIVALALLVAVVPPLLLWVPTRLVAAVAPRAGAWAHAGALGLLVAVLVRQVVEQQGPTAPTVLAGGLPVLAGVAVAVARRRLPAVGEWARWLVVAPVAFVALFLLASPVSGLVTGGDVETADLGAFGSGTPPPVVVVVLDEWPLASIVRRDGSLDARRYPNVAALADDATWYRDTTTVANLTNFAVPALLTGRHPQEGATADAASHPENLFTLLGGTYRLDVTERITRLCPAQLCGRGGGRTAAPEAAALPDLVTEAARTLGTRLGVTDEGRGTTDVFVEPDAAVAEARRDDQGQVLDDLLAPRPESLDRFLRGFRADEAPTLHVLHLLSPHTPHRHLADGNRYADPGGIRLVAPVAGTDQDDRRAPAAPAAALDRVRLQHEVAHVDRLLGDLLDRLRATGLYEDALLVVTSDHGIAFRPGATARGLGPDPVEAEAEPELLWVPLFVKAPGQTEGAVSDVPAQSVDVVPTIAALLDIDLPWAVDGVALPDGAAADRVRRYWRVQGSSFATFRLDPPRVPRADLDDVLALGTDAVLTPGADPWWSLPPATGLVVGAPVTGPTLPALVDGPGRFAAVDPDDPEVPALVAGRVGGGARQVVVAVGGRVAALATTYDDGEGPGRFAVLVPPAAFATPDDRVTVHAVPG